MQMKKTNQLAIPDLQPSTKIRVVLDAFSKYETDIIGVKLLKQKKGKEEGMKVAYIEFDSVDITENAFGDGTIKIAGAVKNLRYAKKRAQKFGEKGVISEKKVYVSGIPLDADKDDLSKLLGKCTISGLEKRSGYVFAEYSTHKERDDAITRINNSKLNNVALSASPAYERPASRTSSFSSKRSSSSTD
ncbi:hypothetical protein CWI42_021820 [Ordospora colligata]|uniref:RRM domain-containing protein n=1 Tax=Ordospora colligata OC4 TaxID=1354746 RepID=A0A0B2ULY3_9MICR|nr:uncharacterized protein M896_021830 [Ordospora colligata OC4]KHN70343.1 hypothetical protein M896_021830 [Ordospora colligata OC4]TBU16887.1 hypothetical protein CWI41_021840 [Ordospora colligata]TBU16995.1 hypothetical protein CWI40_021840 [Ordospora colligata]TBU19436.1 hypothetical protein CWI42_021820 [Ordospora colligata]